MRGEEVSVEKIRGRQVLDRAGNELGNVEDVTFNPQGLRVTGFIVRVTRDAAEHLRLDKPVLGSARIEVGADRLGSIGDNILLNVDRSEIATMLYEEARP